MFCKNCGTQLPDGAVFCGSCGTKVETQPTAQPAYQAVQEPVYVAPQQTAAPDPALNELAGTVLSRGITGLALSACLGLPGIFVSAKAKNLAAEYERRAGGLSGKAKVGSILAKVGFPLGFGMTGFYVLYFIIALASAL